MTNVLDVKEEVLDPTAAAAAAPTRPGALRAVLRNPLGMVSLIILGIIVLLSLLAPLIAPYDPTQLRLPMINAAPGGDYLLGGDGVGRDILSRLLHAGSRTLLGALIAVVVAAAIGITGGLIGGYYGGVSDGVFGWSSNILMALPNMVVLLAVFQALGSNVMLAMVAFGVMISPSFYRLVRGQVNAVKNELYVDAARVSGLSDWRIIARHVLLVVRAPVIIQASIVAGIGIVLQSGLEFLGLGDPSTPTWGGMLQDAFANTYTAPTAVLWPGLAIALTVASLVLLGNAIRDVTQRTAGSSAPKKGGLLRPQKVATTHAGEAAPAKVDADVLLEISDLTVGYPQGDGSYKEVVHGIDLEVRRGEVLGLVGESGSGKSQTAFSVLGLLPPGGAILGDSSILFDGKELTAFSEKEYEALRGRRIGYIPQEPMSNLDPCFRIGFQLVEPLRAAMGMSKAEATAEALRLLGRVGIPDPQRTFDSYPHEISGGMAQRVLIAGAMACRPDLLIADEPTTALDVTVQAEVLDLIRDLQAEYGMSVLLVTHNFGVVADVCHRVAVMQLGKIVEVNDAETLFADPQHSYTKMLLDSTLEDSDTREYRAPERTAS